MFQRFITHVPDMSKYNMCGPRGAIMWPNHSPETGNVAPMIVHQRFKYWPFLDYNFLTTHSNGST